MKIFLKIFSLFLIIIIFFSFLFNFLLPLKNVSKNFLLPKTSINLALNYYFQKKYHKSAKVFNYFNKWQPTVETLLFEAYCLQKESKLSEAKDLIKKALNFNPRDKNAHLAIIDLNFEIFKRDKKMAILDEMMFFVPYDDKEAIDKICYKLLKISNDVKGDLKLQIYGKIFYLSPSNSILKKLLESIIDDEDINPKAKKFGFYLYFLQRYFNLNFSERSDFLKEIGFIFFKIYEKG